MSIPTALPSTSSRTTSSAVPVPILAEVSLGPINLSSSLVSNNALVDHIDRYNLGLQERPLVPADGNCWFWTNTDLIKKYGIVAPEDPNELRMAVANSLDMHKHKSYWMKTIFQGKVRKYKKFVKEQSQPGNFIDNYGIMVIATADYLDVKYHLIGTSNNSKNPFTVLGQEDRDIVFHVGLYQDTTDVSDQGRSGHYQSLEPVPGLAVPCCNILPELVTVSVPIDRDVTIDIQETLRQEVKEKIEIEENILRMFKNDKEMVTLSLKRIANIKDVDTEVLFKTDISNILYSDLRKLYDAGSPQGKLVRRILKRYQNLCKSDPRLRNEDLPEISDVSDDNEEVQEPVRSFRSLFTSDRRRSVLCAGINSASDELCNVTSAPVHMASSTIVTDAVPEKRKRPPPLSQVFLDCLEADSRQVMASTPAPAFVRSDSLVLTPPPPTPPTPPSVRSPSLVLTPRSPTPSPSPPPRRKRGRPANLIVLSTATTPSPP